MSVGQTDRLVCPILLDPLPLETSCLIVTMVSENPGGINIESATSHALTRKKNSEELHSFKYPFRGNSL